MPDSYGQPVQHRAVREALLACAPDHAERLKAIDDEISKLRGDL